MRSDARHRMFSHVICRHRGRHPLRSFAVYLIMVVSSPFFFGGLTAKAQQPSSAPPANELAEIVVTARQREEKLSDVPATVQAFTSAEIKSAGIERPMDFIGLTTGVSAVQTVEVGDMQINIRGINSGRDTEGSYALVVDGVLMTNPNVINQELSGVSQIEVLKGPQGALYGRNALAGAIIMTTKKPTDDLEADAKAGFGNYRQWNASLGVSGPLSPAVSGSLRGYITNNNGSFKNSLTGCDNCENFSRETGVNGRLVIKASDKAEFDIKARYSHVDAGAVTFNASLALYQAAAFYTANPGFLPPGVIAGSFYENPNDHQFVYLNLVPPTNIQTNKDISVKSTIDLDFATLTTTLSFNDENNYFLSDGTSNAFGIYDLNSTCQQSYAAAAGKVPLPSPFFYADPHGSSANIASSFLPPYPPVTCGGYQYQQRDQKDGAIEFRLTSPGNQPLRWMGGMYVGEINRHLVVSYGGDLGTGVYNTGYVPPSGPNPTDLLFDDTFRSNIYSVFGNIEHDLTFRNPNDAEIAFAMRYDVEDRADNNNVPKINPGTPGFDPLYLSQLGSAGGPKSVCTPGVACSYYINPYYNANPTASSIPTRNRSFAQPQPKLNTLINAHFPVHPHRIVRHAAARVLPAPGLPTANSAPLLPVVTSAPAASTALPGVVVPTAAPGTILPGSPSGPYGVIQVPAGGTLNVRSAAGTDNSVIATFAASANNVMRTGPSTNLKNVLWVQVTIPNGGTGWVDSAYLTEYVAPAIFCADGRVNTLLTNFGNAVKNSNGAALSPLVSPDHGMSVRLWRNGNVVVFDQAHAQWIFTSSFSHDWGAAPAAGWIRSGRSTRRSCPNG